MDAANLSGPLKVAILFQTIGQDNAQKIFKSFNHQEQMLLKKNLFEMENVSSEVVEKIAEEFVLMLSGEIPRPVINIFAPKEGQSFEEFSRSQVFDSSSLRAIRSLDSNQLFQMIQDEHPQTIAIILAHIKSNIASEIVAKLPDNIRTDVAFRVARLDKVVSGMIEEIDHLFEDILKDSDTSITDEPGGTGCMAEILNQIEGTAGETILEEMEETDPELAAQIKQLMFVFEDLVLVDDRGLQKVLRSVETKDLALSLKAASDEVKEKIFRNMSQRAGEMLEEEIEALGPIRMKEVADAQQVITNIIQDKEKKNEVIISGRKGEEFVS